MPTSHPNIVVVICHDLGQHLGCYGVPEVRSPQIDAFAGAGIRFENSFCTAPQCSPSRAALWTGRFPHANGVIGLTHGGFANDLHADELHLAQILRANGYETHLFGVQHEARNPERAGHEFIHPGALSREVAGDFCQFLSKREPSDRPLFAQIGFEEPHRPFPHQGVDSLPLEQMNVPPYLPDIPVVREDLADLEASVVCVDQAFSSILEALNDSDIAENTILVFTADHGTAFTHAKMTLYDPGIEVPLILSAPDIPLGRVYQEMISNVDLVPTLLEFAGIPLPDNLQGCSFYNLLRGETYTPNEAIFAEKTYHTYYDPMRAIRNQEWKLIANFENAPWQETSPDYDNNAKSYVEVAKALDPSYEVQYHPPFELFDLQADPYEAHNLADDPVYRPIRDELARRLRDWMEATGDPLLDGPIAQGAYLERMKAFRKL
jgi:N-sulfoglucosamine sulfohydrolase